MNRSFVFIVEASVLLRHLSVPHLTSQWNTQSVRELVWSIILPLPKEQFALQQLQIHINSRF